MVPYVRNVLDKGSTKLQGVRSARARRTRVAFNAATGSWSARRRVDGVWHWLGEFSSNALAYEATRCPIRLAAIVERQQHTDS